MSRNYPHIFLLAAAAGALVGACDPIDKPIGEQPGVYEPCADKGCGETCNVCDPDDADCVETAVLKACNPEGQCVPETWGLCEDVYDPCGGKAPCDTCTQCDPKDPDCVETAVLKVCNEALACVIAVPGVCEEPPAYAPCEGAACGVSCTQCDPKDPDCVETAVIKACDGEGACVPETPDLCDVPPEYAPCDGAACGVSCTQCDPKDLDCVETAVIKACDGEGACVPETPDLCEEPPPYAPCLGAACGVECTICAPNDPDCVEDAVIKACDGEGTCVPVHDELCVEPAYDPCAGKACGEQCMQCDPNDPDCVETAVLKACNSIGACVPQIPGLCQAP